MVLPAPALVLAPYTASTQLQKQVKHRCNSGKVYVFVPVCLIPRYDGKALSASTGSLIQIRIKILPGSVPSTEVRAAVVHQQRRAGSCWHKSSAEVAVEDCAVCARLQRTRNHKHF